MDKLDPNEALQVQDVIEETIKEMEADNNKNKKLKKGNNNLLIDTEKLQLKKGTYVVFLYYNNTQNYYWITEE